MATTRVFQESVLLSRHDHRFACLLSLYVEGVKWVDVVTKAPRIELNCFMRAHVRKAYDRYARVVSV